MKRSCADKTAQRVISVCKSTLYLLLLVAVFLATAKSAISAPPLFFGGKQKPKAEGLNRIPMDRLDADAREKVLSVINHTSVYRKMTPQMIDCDPRYYMFLIRHPEVIVGIWQLMDATEMTITRDGPGRFTATDGAGTIGNLEFLYGDQKVHILYGKGSYTGNLTKRPIRADCLLVLHTEFVPHESGRQYVRERFKISSGTLPNRTLLKRPALSPSFLGPPKKMAPESNTWQADSLRSMMMSAMNSPCMPVQCTEGHCCATTLQKRPTAQSSKRPLPSRRRGDRGTCLQVLHCARDSFARVSLLLRENHPDVYFSGN